jgi:hypothetical protein
MMSLSSCSSNTDGSARNSSDAEPQSASSPSPDTTAPSTPGIQVVAAKPAEGKGNVRGQVLYNSQHVTADNILSVSSINLFKSDLKLVNPAAGSQVIGQNLRLSWDAYPDAAYYKLNVYPEDSSTVDNYGTLQVHLVQSLVL